MGAISIITSRFLSLYIGKGRRIFNLLASLLSGFRTQNVSSASAEPPESLRDHSIPTVQFTRLHRAFRMVRLFPSVREATIHE
jgi:hypothetical protein